VNVDEYEVGARPELGDDGVRLGERGAGRLHEDGTGEVRDAQAHPVRLHHGGAATRAALGVVGRPDHPLVAIEEAVDLGVPVGVVAEGERVDSHVEQLLRGLLRDTHATGRVLAVGDDEVGRVLLAQAGQNGRQRAAADPADDIAHEQEFHGGRFCQGDLNAAAGHSGRLR